MIGSSKSKEGGMLPAMLFYHHCYKIPNRVAMNCNHHYVQFPRLREGQLDELWEEVRTS